MSSTTDFTYYLSRLREIIQEEVKCGGELLYDDEKWTCSDDEDEEVKMTDCKIQYLDDCKMLSLNKNTLENKVRFIIYQELYNEMCDRCYGGNEYQQEMESIGKFILESKDELKKESKIKEQRIRIIKNIHGNFEHLGTGFVFDGITQKVFGKRSGDIVIQLSDDDKLKCKELWFQYE